MHLNSAAFFSLIPREAFSEKNVLLFMSDTAIMYDWIQFWGVQKNI